MKTVIDFLRRLSANNNREWFHAHKSEYVEAGARFHRFVERLIDGIRQFDSSIGQLSVADCTYRIYRDTRFSADKTPYKNHMGAFICPGGKRSGFSGYYFQVGAFDESEYDAGNMLAVGNYYCDSDVLQLLREDISLDEGRDFEATLRHARGFELDFGNALKRVPKGYPSDAPYAQWLRLRNFCLVKGIDHGYVSSENLLPMLLDDFRSAKPFLEFVNRAIEYSRETKNDSNGFLGN